ncbi:SixA phosphatase family protein [Thiomicrorhabdus xiamenensis]|uniref:Histidine phosphatase family protein n=1 Tax=Thiomicrorhabdus xiamenensis TaxID=2739063 RepID=A0A7D4P363_9GAMM|nr:histidine phosphatase family protein [Thiomicrorhabdus xiamenensis]QKI88396.1 histidine phosphatase family protein [Thiomicrorhabdus xiamenensis]
MANKLRELLLVRHAKSDWKEPDQEDLDRPLSDKGKKNAKKIGKWLLNQGLLPDLILVSPAQRAQQTLRRICSECPALSQTVDALYMAELDTLKQLLSSVEEANRVMIIGHNPGLEKLFCFLQNKPLEGDTHLFPTASVAHFILPENWHNLEAGDGILQQFIRPRDIKHSEHSAKTA